MASIPTKAKPLSKPRSIHVVLDFDGTIGIDDVGDLMFKTFGEFEPIHTELLNGKHTVAEYYRRSASMLKPECTPERLHEWALEREVDPGFTGLVAMCKREGALVSVASDGFINYIEPIVKNAGVDDLPVNSNRLLWNNGWTPEFPGATESCSCFCASCKRNAVITPVDENDILVYIGDGMSDRCAAEHSDIVFAKGSLAAWCTEQRIPHHPYKTLFDVRRMLASRFANNDFRHRRQAVLARRSAFISE